MLLDRDSLALPVDDATWSIFNRAQQDQYGQELVCYHRDQRDREASDPRVDRLERRIEQLEAELRSTRAADRVATENLIADALGAVWKQLREQIEALEQRRAPTYRGLYSDGVGYDVADMVTHGGSIWHCRKATNEKPTTSSPDWVLAVKHGRDGKDSRDVGKETR